MMSINRLNKFVFIWQMEHKNILPVMYKSYKIDLAIFTWCYFSLFVLVVKYSYFEIFSLFGAGLKSSQSLEKGMLKVVIKKEIIRSFQGKQDKLHEHRKGQ